MATGRSSASKGKDAALDTSDDGSSSPLTIPSEDRSASSPVPGSDRNETKPTISISSSSLNREGGTSPDEGNCGNAIAASPPGEETIIGGSGRRPVILDELQLRLQARITELFTARIEAQNIVTRTVRASRRIGNGGGILRLAGSYLRVTATPNGGDVTLKMVVMRRRETFLGEILTIAGPEIHLLPEDDFQLDSAQVEVLTCYQQSLQTGMSVKVERRLNHDWDTIAYTQMEGRVIRFSTQTFGRFRFLLLGDGYEKSISHVLYIKEGPDNKFTMKWCFFDDVPEAKSEVEKQMNLLSFRATNIRGSLIARKGDGLRVHLESVTCHISGTTRTISAYDLFSSDTMVMFDFEATHRDGRRMIVPKIKKVDRHGEETVIL